VTPDRFLIDAPASQFSVLFVTHTIDEAIFLATGRGDVAWTRPDRQ
jgi:ABC-type nitrate/sulfonate/bicarbonate transport system ATPase subunit